MSNVSGMFGVIDRGEESVSAIVACGVERIREAVRYARENPEAISAVNVVLDRLKVRDKFTGEILQLDQNSLSAPRKLYCAGNCGHLATESPTVAFVGTTSPDRSAASVTRVLARTAASLGWIVVGGFVAGIDMNGHEGAVDADKPSIGVVSNVPTWPACDYHAAFQQVYRNNLKNEGVFVSEYETLQSNKDAMSVGERVLIRNRILSMLSDYVVVVEARADSETVHGALCALLQGKELVLIDWQNITLQFPFAGNTSGYDQLLDVASQPELAAIRSRISLFPEKCIHEENGGFRALQEAFLDQVLTCNGELRSSVF